MAAYNKRYYAAHKDEICLQNKRYCAEHKDEIKSRSKRYYREHKDALNAYQKQYYREHANEIGARSKRRHHTHRRALVASLKNGKSCIYCGESNPVCLDWHHRNPGNKLFNISTVGSTKESLEFLQDEIAKCDMVCANCHRKIHFGASVSSREYKRGKNVSTP